MESTVTSGTKYLVVCMLVERREASALLSDRLCHKVDIIMWYFCALSLSSWACGESRNCPCSASDHSLELSCPSRPWSWLGVEAFPCITSQTWLSACVDNPLLDYSQEFLGQVWILYPLTVLPPHYESVNCLLCSVIVCWGIQLWCSHACIY